MRGINNICQSRYSSDLTAHVKQIARSFRFLFWQNASIEVISQALSQDVQEVCYHVVTSAISNIDLKGRFQPTADISGQTTVKSSIQRGIRSAILSSWKIDVETLEEIWPKKESIVHVKWCVASILFRVAKEKSDSRSRFICVGGLKSIEL